MKDEEIDCKNVGDQDYQSIIARSCDGLVTVNPKGDLTEVKRPRIKYSGKVLSTRQVCGSLTESLKSNQCKCVFDVRQTLQPISDKVTDIDIVS